MLHISDVDLTSLAMALENHFMDYDTFFWMDPATGRIQLWGEEAADEADAEGWDIEDRGGVRIEAIDSFEGFGDMEAFIFSVKDTHCRAELARSIDRSKPFRHFKDALHQFPQEQTDWNEFHDAIMKVRAIEWLRDNGLVESAEAEATVVQLRPIA